MALLAQEEAKDMMVHPRRRTPFSWRGLTLFVEDPKSKSPPVHGAFIQGETMFRVPWPKEKMHVWEDVVKDLQTQTSSGNLLAANEGKWQGARSQMLR